MTSYVLKFDIESTLVTRGPKLMFANTCNRNLLTMLALLSGVFFLASTAMAATPSASAALRLAPIQKDVDYDTPSTEEQEKCSVKAENRGTAGGWVVRDPSERLLRQYLDTNKDNKVDQWCYYKDGVEVYRDIDANFNGKADQYRWLGTAGIRWGLDRDEDGSVDTWKMISAEEVTAEVVAALRDRDVSRFRAVLLTTGELDTLGLGDVQKKDLSEKIAKSSSEFGALAQRQKVVGQGSRWIHFGGTRPGVLPAGSNGSTKDLVVYDNVTAVVETDGKHAQLAVGTLVRVGDLWRVVNLPQSLVDGQASSELTGIFFNAVMTRPVSTEVPVEGGLSEAMQKLIADFEEIDKSLRAATTTTQKISLHQRRADILEKLTSETKEKGERNNWVRQFADTISAAVQAKEFPAGIDRLSAFQEKLDKAGDADGAAYVRYRYMSAVYSKSLEDPEADFAKIQEDWLKQLEGFVEKYPKAEDAADAMLQLALAQEFAGKEDDAKKWYKRIITDFPGAALSKKAEGAIRRLDSVGKTISFSGRSIDGRTVSLDSYKGKVVLLHYWATWCEPCKQDLDVLKNLYAKYGKDGFTLIGVSLDSERGEVDEYVRSSRLPWAQLYEEGGLDSRLANELGILTLPAMMLFDKQGRVVSRSIHTGELDTELGKLLR